MNPAINLIRRQLLHIIRDIEDIVFRCSRFLFFIVQVLNIELLHLQCVERVFLDPLLLSSTRHDILQVIFHFLLVFCSFRTVRVIKLCSASDLVHGTSLHGRV